MKRILSILAVITIVLTLCACGNKGIEGKWENKEYGITVEFKSNGELIFTEIGDETETGKWELKGTKVYVDGNETDFVFEDGELVAVDGDEKIDFKRK